MSDDEDRPDDEMEDDAPAGPPAREMTPREHAEARMQPDEGSVTIEPAPDEDEAEPPPDDESE